jgi:hypothetical protein
MDEREDNFEVEVTDLETGERIRHPLGESVATTAAQQKADGGATMAPPRFRRVRALLVASAVLLAVALVVVIDPAMRASLSTALHPTPVPSATLAPDANLVFLDSGAPWGTYSLDGLITAPLAPPGSRLSSVWVRLTPGRHTLTVTQAPFPTLTCTISLPAARSDTCPLVTPTELYGSYFGSQPGSSSNTRVIDLGARFDRLPPPAAADLVEAVRTLLSVPAAPMTLLPGDHYPRDDGSVAVAREPLQITMPLELTPPDRSVPSDSADCQSFCDTLTDYDRGGVTGGLWSLMVGQSATWRATAADGQVVASHAPLWPSAAPYDSLSPDTRELHSNFDVQWDGSWQILSQGHFSADDLSPPLFLVATQMVDALLSASPAISTSNMNIYQAQWLDAGHGYVFSLIPSDPSTTTPLVLYYHFGMLLAANDTAHHAFPEIPGVSANERAQARSIMGQAG